MVFSGSWDTFVYGWNCSSNPKAILKIDIKEKVYGMKYRNGKICVGSADGMVKVFDVRKADTEIVSYKAKDGHINCVDVMPNEDGVVYATDEGKVGVLFFTETEERQSYIFRTQRKFNPITNKIDVKMVNGISFHPTGVLCTGGGDGTYSIWDLFASDRCKESVRYSLAITDVCFSPDGKYLSFSLGYDWEKV